MPCNDQPAERTQRSITDDCLTSRSRVEKGLFTIYSGVEAVDFRVLKLASIILCLLILTLMAKLLQQIKIWTGFDKYENLKKIIEHNGGLINSAKKLYYHDDLKIGTLVGTDDFGNKYYENPKYFVPRNRWVEFSEKRGLDYNASQIPPEWHRWMTQMTEYPPTVEKPVSYPWMLPHQENMTGTPDAYMPHNTVQPKIQAWSPGSKTNPRLAIESKS